MTNKHTILVILVVGLVLAGGLYYRYHTPATDERGATKLMRSIEAQENLKDTERLIRRSDDINVRDNAGKTALFYAARKASDPQVVRSLIAAGASVQLTDEQGRTALMEAAEHNALVGITNELVKENAPVNKADNAGNTALMLASRGNIPAVIKTLLRAGADPDAVGPEGKTAAELLAKNTKLTDTEKTDYRQAMLVISILRPAN